MKELTDQEIKRFLETAPLYSKESFSMKSNRIDINTPQIDLTCLKCGQLRPFNNKDGRLTRPSPGDFSIARGPGQPAPRLNSGIQLQKFFCVTCQSEFSFMISIDNTNNIVTLEKSGQHPRLKLNRDKYIEQFSEKDAEYYEKAVICESHGYGIAAFAYYRRILETHISKLLDMIQEDVIATGQSDEVLSALNSLRPDSPMSDKIEVANTALPQHLCANGINPLGRLYKALSEGVHQNADDLCLKSANIIRDCLKFLLSELASRKSQREILARNLGKL